MKLSFVIPAYNEETNIGKCLGKIREEIQNKPYDIEIIVVNNASTDRTKEIASSFQNVKIVDEPKKGLVQARQSGFIASSGDLIANVDADTILTPRWIDKVLEEFSKNSELIALSGPFIYYDLPRATNIGVRIFYYLGFVSYLANRFIFRTGAMLQGGNFIIRKSALEKIGGYNLEFDFYGEDTDIACRLNKIGPVKFTFNLPMYTSGRRLAAEGVITMGMRYGINYLWTIIFKKPFTKNFIDIRPKNNKSHFS